MGLTLLIPLLKKLPCGSRKKTSWLGIRLPKSGCTKINTMNFKASRNFFFLNHETRIMAGNKERTFLMLKPDAVHRGLIGDIVKRFEQKGFKLVAMKFMHASEELLKEHYADLSTKKFFPGLIKYMNSGPVVPMVWEGLNVVKTGRVMLGATNPADSAPGTIRGDFCIQVGRNICHGSDAVDSAAKEIALWFKEENLVAWDPVAEKWVYED
jgi:nucleoside-diphosphate kinase